MKIICRVTGGPNEGVYEDDDWPRTHSYPLRGWGAITDNFHMGTSFDSACQTVVEAKGARRARSFEIVRKHKYRVMGRTETEGVLVVDLKHCGVQSGTLE